MKWKDFLHIIDFKDYWLINRLSAMFSNFSYRYKQNPILVDFYLLKSLIYMKQTLFSHKMLFHWQFNKDDCPNYCGMTTNRINATVCMMQYLPISSRMLPLRARHSVSSLKTLVCVILPRVMRAFRSSGGGVRNTCCRSSRDAVTTLWSQCCV